MSTNILIYLPHAALIGLKSIFATSSAVIGHPARTEATNAMADKQMSNPENFIVRMYRIGLKSQNSSFQSRDTQSKFLLKIKKELNLVKMDLWMDLCKALVS